MGEHKTQKFRPRITALETNVVEANQRRKRILKVMERDQQENFGRWNEEREKEKSGKADDWSKVPQSR